MRLATFHDDSTLKQFTADLDASTANIAQIGQLQIHWLIAHSIVWALVFCAICFGVRGLGKMMVFTLFVPFVLLFGLFGRSMFLGGALEKFQPFFMNSLDWERLKDWMVWKTAAEQAIIATGLGFGAFITLGSYNKRSNNLVQDSFLLLFAHILISALQLATIIALVGHISQKVDLSPGELISRGENQFFQLAVYLAYIPHTKIFAGMFLFMVAFMLLNIFYVLALGILATFEDALGEKWSRCCPRSLFHWLFVCAIGMGVRCQLCFYNAGIKIDYRGEDVNAANFMAILEGNSEKTNGKPVLNSTENDNVFIYNDQHGGHGLLSFPEGILTLKELKTTLTNMNNKKMYKKLVFDLDACESGSMFESWATELEQMHSTVLLDFSSRVYALTSTNGKSPSWAFYCDSSLDRHPELSCNECHDLAPNSCLGGDFGRSWILNVDYLPDLSLQTMGKETEYAKMGTMFSQVQEFGDMEIKNDKISEFMGNKLGRQPYKKNELIISSHNYPAVPINNSTEIFIKSRIMRGDQAAVKELELLNMSRQYFDGQMQMLVDRLLTSKSTLKIRHRVLTENQGWISRMDCHDQVIRHFNQKCFNFAKNQYAITKSFILNNFFELGLPIKRIVSVMDEHCSDLKITNGIE